MPKLNMGSVSLFRFASARPGRGIRPPGGHDYPALQGPGDVAPGSRDRPAGSSEDLRALGHAAGGQSFERIRARCAWRGWWGGYEDLSGLAESEYRVSVVVQVRNGSSRPWHPLARRARRRVHAPRGMRHGEQALTDPGEVSRGAEGPADRDDIQRAGRGAGSARSDISRPFGTQGRPGALARGCEAPPGRAESEHRASVVVQVRIGSSGAWHSSPGGLVGGCTRPGGMRQGNRLWQIRARCRGVRKVRRIAMTSNERAGAPGLPGVTSAGPSERRVDPAPWPADAKSPPVR